MSGLYYQVIRVTDFGPYVTKLILAMPEAVTKEDLCPEQFSVFVEVRNAQGDVVKVPKSFIERDIMEPSRGYRTVTDVYPCTAEGEKAEGSSRFAALELAYGPLYKCSSALVADFSNVNGHEFFAVCDYKVTLTQPVGEKRMAGLVFDTCAKVYCPQRERFMNSISHGSIPLQYGYYTPDLTGGKKPLIVWLHGAGEGGQDIAIAYAGNKVTELTEKWVQDKFGGAFVFVPQCPTMWLDDGSGQYGDSGNSMYVKALKEAIDEFIARFADVIDTDRIYVGGDSNGGFMTVRMIMDYPEFFAAAFPICEAMPDKRISDEQIGYLKDLPIWFTHCKTDPIVVPDLYVLPTYHRLIAAGAGNVHMTYWDAITDIHEGFKTADGKPWEYMGHFAWIPMLNDDCRLDFDGSPVTYEGKEVTLLDWLSMQHK